MRPPPVDDENQPDQPSTSTPTALRLFDAHAHLQSPRLAPLLDAVMTAATSAGVVAVAVNATHEGDWGGVLGLAAASCTRPGWPAVRPSLGIHPWRLDTRSPGWEARLRAALAAHPGCGVGESGLDRAPKGLAAARELSEGAAVLEAHLDLATSLGRPVTLHCVRAVGPLTDALAARAPFPAGVLLHAWAGSPEATARLAALGGVYFSVGARQVASPPPRGQEGVRQPVSAKARAMLAAIPADRLLLETDSPDAFVPGFGMPAEWAGGGGGGGVPPPSPPCNQPANLVAVVAAVAEATGRDAAAVAAAACAAAERLFGAV